MLFFSFMALLIVIVDSGGPTAEQLGSCPRMNTLGPFQRICQPPDSNVSLARACLCQCSSAGSRREEKKPRQFVGLSVAYFISASNVTVAARTLGCTESNYLHPPPHSHPPPLRLMRIHNGAISSTSVPALLSTARCSSCSLVTGVSVD